MESVQLMNSADVQRITRHRTYEPIPQSSQADDAWLSAQMKGIVKQGLNPDEPEFWTVTDYYGQPIIMQRNRSLWIPGSDGAEGHWISESNPFNPDRPTEQRAHRQRTHDLLNSKMAQVAKGIRRQGGTEKPQHVAPYKPSMTEINSMPLFKVPPSDVEKSGDVPYGEARPRTGTHLPAIESLWRSGELKEASKAYIRNNIDIRDRLNGLRAAGTGYHGYGAPNNSNNWRE